LEAVLVLAVVVVLVLAVGVGAGVFPSVVVIPLCHCRSPFTVVPLHPPGSTPSPPASSRSQAGWWCLSEWWPSGSRWLDIIVIKAKNLKRNRKS
jgi:hypothetical protein